MSHLPFRRGRRPPRGAPIVVVSGLPRSGTSMAMSMLEAGGVAILTDGMRVADAHNPRGYYEYEKVKTLDVDADASWLESARGKAIKIISFLLPHLPPTYDYRVVFMHRDMGEILSSQHKMLTGGVPSDPEVDRRFAHAFEDHLTVIDDMLRRRSWFEVLDLRFEEVLNGPSEQAERLARFVGGALDVARMAAVVDSGLYRNRR